jgi:hypothetical protein
VNIYNDNFGHSVPPFITEEIVERCLTAREDRELLKLDWTGGAWDQRSRLPGSQTKVPKEPTKYRADLPSLPKARPLLSHLPSSTLTLSLRRVPKNGIAACVDPFLKDSRRHSAIEPEVQVHVPLVWEVHSGAALRCQGAPEAIPEVCWLWCEKAAIHGLRQKQEVEDACENIDKALPIE